MHQHPRGEKKGPIPGSLSCGNDQVMARSRPSPIIQGPTSGVDRNAMPWTRGHPSALGTGPGTEVLSSVPALRADTAATSCVVSGNRSDGLIARSRSSVLPTTWWPRIPFRAARDAVSWKRCAARFPFVSQPRMVALPRAFRRTRIQGTGCSDHRDAIHCRQGEASVALLHQESKRGRFRGPLPFNNH